ncbi:MAG TPA: hypothetical protein PLB74_03085 [Candidatus Paceibacterota bacterium]|nr:hypothetical protein [Candidatus Paceibacterota bacterium]
MNKIPNVFDPFVKVINDQFHNFLTNPTYKDIYQELIYDFQNEPDVHLSLIYTNDKGMFCCIFKGDSDEIMEEYLNWEDLETFILDYLTKF